MAKETYGSVQYYEDRMNVAELTVELVKEALASRLQSGKVTADELRMYADVLDNAEGAAKYERGEYDKACDRFCMADPETTTPKESNDK